MDISPKGRDLKPVEESHLSAVKPAAGHTIEYDGAFIDSLFEGVLSFGKTGQVSFCNKAAEQILGITKDQINGLTPMDPRWGSIHEDGTPFPGHEHPSMYTLRTGVPCKNVIMGITKPGGTITWVTVNSQPVYRPGSSLPDSVTCSFVDITSERLMLEELREAERIQRLALSSTSSGFYALDLGFHLRIISKPGESLARTILERDLAVGDYYPDFVDEDRKEIILGYLKTALNGVETTYNITRRRNGKLHYFLILFGPIFDEASKVVGLYIVVRDVTSQKEAERLLQQSNERHAFACKATSDVIWDWDIVENKIYLAEASIKLFGSLTLITDIDARIAHVHPQDRKKYKSSIQQALIGNGDFWQGEYRFRTAKGHYKFVLDKSYIIRDNNKKAVRMIGAMQDVTSHRKLESRLLQEVDKRKREIIKAIISAQEKEKKEISDELHDNVSQLLATCNLYIDASITQSRPELLIESKTLLKSSIEELRNISHSLTPAAFEEKGLFDTVEEMTEKINQLGTLTIALHFPDRKTLEKQLISEMKTAIYRIIQEQVKNILKHSKASEVAISFEASQNHLVLEISDNGKGFKLQKLKRGLGLNNIQSRVALFNGELVIKSGPGKGCLIKAIFPLKAGKDGKTA